MSSSGTIGQIEGESITLHRGVILLIVNGNAQQNWFNYPSLRYFSM